MTSTHTARLTAAKISNALLHQNPILVQFIGLCPLLAVSSSFVNAFVLGLCTLFVLVVAMSLVSFLRTRIRLEIRLPIFILLIAGFTTLIEFALQLLTYSLYIAIGLFIPLITTNCLLLARAEAFASKKTVSQSLLDALFMGLGFFWVMLAMGAIRELLGSGSLFVGMAELTSIWPTSWLVQSGYFSGIPLFILPPGGFLVLGLMLAAFNAWQAKQQQQKTSQQGVAHNESTQNAIT